MYGGEELDPPQFGRVVVAIDTVNNEGITEADKTEYTEFVTLACVSHAYHKIRKEITFRD